MGWCGSRLVVPQGLQLVGQGPRLGRERVKRVQVVPGRGIASPGCRLEVVPVPLPEAVLAWRWETITRRSAWHRFVALRGGKRPALFPGEIPNLYVVIVNRGTDLGISMGGVPCDVLVAGRVWHRRPPTRPGPSGWAWWTRAVPARCRSPAARRRTRAPADRSCVQSGARGVR